MRTTIGERVRTYRLRRGLTQARLAHLVGRHVCFEFGPEFRLASLTTVLTTAHSSHEHAPGDRGSPGRWVEASVRMRMLEAQLETVSAVAEVPPAVAEQTDVPLPVAPAVEVEPAPVSAPLLETTQATQPAAVLGRRWAALGMLVAVVAVSAVLAPLSLALAVLVLFLAWAPGRWG